MADSPIRRSDPLKDAEARVRALTREVGTLREDLRRETKRRERAVVQAQEAEAARKATDSRAQELAYSNKKLAAELDSLHEVARAGAERDRRTLRSLREGLAAVEQAVAERGRNGYAQVRVLYETMQQLRAVLFTPSQLLNNVPAVAPAVAPRTSELLDSLTCQASTLATLLSGPPPASGSVANTAKQPAAAVAVGSVDGMDAAAAGGAPGGAFAQPHGLGAGHAGSSGVGSLSSEAAHAQLQDEVVRLRAEVKLLTDRASGNGYSSTLELHRSLQEAQSEVVRLKAELVHANALLAVAHKEQQEQAEQLQQTRDRLAAQDALQAQMLSAARNREDSSMGLLVERAALQEEAQTLQQQLSQLQAERSTLTARLAEAEREAQRATAQLEATKASISQQEADIRNALQLIPRAAGAGLAAAQSSAIIAAAPQHHEALAGSRLAPPPYAYTGPGQAATSVALDPSLAALPYFSGGSSAISSALAAAAALAPARSASTALQESSSGALPLANVQMWQPAPQRQRQHELAAAGAGAVTGQRPAVTGITGVAAPQLNAPARLAGRAVSWAAAGLGPQPPANDGAGTCSATAPGVLATQLAASGDVRAAVLAAATAMGLQPARNSLQKLGALRPQHGDASAPYSSAVQGPGADRWAGDVAGKGRDAQAVPRSMQARAHGRGVPMVERGSRPAMDSSSSSDDDRPSSRSLPPGRSQQRPAASDTSWAGGAKQLAALRKDMMSLDDEIAQLEQSLQAAAAKM